MSINIKNKAEEIKAWADTVHSDDGEIGFMDIRAQVLKRWPDLMPDIREEISRLAFALCIRNAEPF